MLFRPKLFRNKKEFFIVSIFFILLIALRLLLLYNDYLALRRLPNYFYTEAQVIKLYPAKDGATLLKLHSIEGLDFYLYTPKEPKRFDWVRVKIKLKKNTSFFDYLRGFFAKGAVVEKVQEGFDAKAYFRKKIDKQHQKYKSLRSFYYAIFLADPLQKELRQKVSNLGVSHLIALSGFHLGILWILLFGVLYFPYKALQERFFPWRNRNIDLGFITLLLLAFYVIFVGAPASLLRSYIMLLLAWIMIIFGLEILNFEFLSFTLLLILLFNPKLIASLGLLLSFAGVFYIFLMLKWLKNASPWFISLVAIPIGIFLLMFPIGHFFFGNTSIWQLLSPPLSVVFILFYPISVLLHLLGFGSFFDPALYKLFSLSEHAIKITMPPWLIGAYIVSSFWAVFSKRAFYFTLVFAGAITFYYIYLAS